MKNIYVLLLLISSLFSCDKVYFGEDLGTKDRKKNFEYLWNECNEKYAYFDVKNIDWDAIKVKYESQISEGMSDEAFFNVLGSMLSELKDDHTNLISPLNVSRFGVKKLGQDNFDFRVIEDNYLSDNYYISGPFMHDFIANNEIGYIRFGEFTGTVDDNNLDFILKRYKDTKGLILDLRENGGGAVNDIFSILSRFVEKKTLVYYSRIKTGAAHDDFSELEEAFVEPSDKIRYKKKVIVLIDRGTYSAGSFTALATKALPNITLIGDTTGGGLGMPNGGQLPNGWTYRFSITQALDLSKDPSLEKGVPADIPVSFDWTNMKKDEILETAINELK
ncbi:S41 family peptidase [Flammeovirga kamogawensis]|uniref:S41 family peptidase n=1 Tax=Flammeovirga kamogawensis TaxID=373891 RepID=A0ABX8GUJ1_9BACT|nr:S41 family peptidase [Flammeovirga kamogawensis]MBB6459683.1 C-terminal processing protease CtpA/Prc [Flammeovirga kamogawensis]QWG07255.1 S41 family peptidase [Flammeovirga kamogawensis]TRX69075.1 S41 family peptidase [Flammeovirga kamogawensis]